MCARVLGLGLYSRAEVQAVVCVPGVDICSDLPGPIRGIKTRWCFRSLTKSPCWPACSVAHNPRNQTADWCHVIHGQDAERAAKS